MEKNRILGFFSVFLVIFVLLSMTCYGAEVSGEVFDLSFDSVENVFITVNSTPKQQAVAKDGQFAFNLDVGSYFLKFKSYENNVLVSEANEEVIITNSDGSFILDVILLPTLDDAEFLFESGEVDLDLGGLEDNKTILATEEPEKNVILYSFIGVLLFAIVVAIIIYIWKMVLTRMVRNIEEELEEDDNHDELKNIKTTVEKDEPSKENVLEESSTERNTLEEDKVSDKKTAKEENLEEKAKYDQFISVDTDYKKEVLDVIKKEERITQKDLRRKIPLSEAKVSLIITELYDEGSIKKIKKGRGNILVYNKEKLE